MNQELREQLEIITNYILYIRLGNDFVRQISNPVHDMYRMSILELIQPPPPPRKKKHPKIKKKTPDHQKKT